MTAHGQGQGDKEEQPILGPTVANGVCIGAVSQALMETLCSRLRIVSADLAIGVN